MNIELNHPRMTMELIGPYLPTWLTIAERNPAPITKTLGQLYAHGGGWRPFEGFTLNDDNSLSYPGDPPTLPLATFIFEGAHEGEIAVFYQHEWVAVIAPDRSFEICRMD